jgi:hypothetical protein
MRYSVIAQPRLFADATTKAVFFIVQQLTLKHLTESGSDENREPGAISTPYLELKIKSSSATAPTGSSNHKNGPLLDRWILTVFGTHKLIL